MKNFGLAIFHYKQTTQKNENGLKKWLSVYIGERNLPYNDTAFSFFTLLISQFWKTDISYAPTQYLYKKR